MQHKCSGSMVKVWTVTIFFHMKRFTLACHLCPSLQHLHFKVQLHCGQLLFYVLWHWPCAVFTCDPNDKKHNVKSTWISRILQLQLHVFTRELTTTNLTVDADTTTFIHTMNIDAEMPLGNSLIVNTCISMAKTTALCNATINSSQQSIMVITSICSVLYYTVTANEWTKWQCIIKWPISCQQHFISMLKLHTIAHNTHW